MWLRTSLATTSCIKNLSTYQQYIDIIVFTAITYSANFKINIIYFAKSEQLLILDTVELWYNLRYNLYTVTQVHMTECGHHVHCPDVLLSLPWHSHAYNFLILLSADCVVNDHYVYTFFLELFWVHPVLPLRGGPCGVGPKKFRAGLRAVEPLVDPWGTCTFCY